jgi:ABC-2 type transport system permease protein
MMPSPSTTVEIPPSPERERPRQAAASPPSSWRVVRLVTAMAFCRWTNRIGIRIAPTTRARSATVRKPRMGRGLFVALSILALAYNVILSTAVVHAVALAAERRGHPGMEFVDRRTLQALHYIEDHQRDAIPEGQDTGNWKSSVERILDRYLKRDGARNASETERRKAAMVAVFEQRGTAGFRESQLSRVEVFPSSASWYAQEDSQAMLVPLGLITSLLTMGIVLARSAAANQELATVQSSLPWWFTFPIRARGLFLAMVLETAVVNPLGWLLAFPFFLVVFWCAGYGWLGVPLGASATLYVGLIAGSLRVAIETGLRRFLSFSNIARVKAVAAMITGMAFLALFALVASLLTTTSMEKLPRLPPSVPSWASFHPFLPIGIAAGGAQAWMSFLGCGLFALLTTASATTFADWMVRDGLTINLGPHEERQRRARPSHATFLGPVVATEVRRLVRQRSLLAQIFVFPAVWVGLQLLISPHLWSDVNGRLRTAGVFAFYASYFALSAGAFAALRDEAPAVWMLFTFPKAIDRVFVQKAVFWSGIAAAVAMVSFTLLIGADRQAFYAGAPTLAVVVVGTVLMAFIATGMGALATDVLETVPARRTRNQFYLLLVGGMFVYCIYAPSFWTKFVGIVLYALLAFALWQRFRDHAPFLLDPTEVPLRSLAIADGAIAALAFFMLQNLLSLLGGILQLTPADSLLLAFAGAGVGVGSTALLLFSQSRLPDLETSLGLCLPKRVLPSVMAGIAAGLCSGLFASGYLNLVERVEILHELRSGFLPRLPAEPEARTTALIVVILILAPLFEEFIFRAILYGAFRRSVGPAGAAAASALVFAIVHPPLAFVPIFVMGFLASVLYERSRSLLVPVATHMAYNSVILGLMLQ